MIEAGDAVNEVRVEGVGDVGYTVKLAEPVPS
jgi:hypothetical protein